MDEDEKRDLLGDFEAWLDDLSANEFAKVRQNNYPEINKKLLPKFCRNLPSDELYEIIEDVAVNHDMYCRTD